MKVSLLAFIAFIALFLAIAYAAEDKLEGPIIGIDLGVCFLSY
jgi:hypothetical protein